MGDAPSKPYVSYADYLAIERRSATKHEWLDVDGEPARSGGGVLFSCTLTAGHR